MRDELRWAQQPDRSVRATLRGDWVFANTQSLNVGIDLLSEQAARGGLVLDLSAIANLDTYGAVLIRRLMETRARDASPVRLIGTTGRQETLLHAVAGGSDRTPVPPARRDMLLTAIAGIGALVERQFLDVVETVASLGAFVLSASAAVMRRRIRTVSIVHHLDRIGLQAIPIIVLVTMLVGAIIAQQGFFHFRKFGADTYVVDLVAFLVLRELGVLIVAIVVSGRSGSAITAELGSMKLREEVDALSTMGLDPVDVLVVPRLVALVVGLPLLAFLGDLAALFGAGLVAWTYGGISPVAFLSRLHEAISVENFEVGMIKAPFMAMTIALIATTEGLKVSGSADSVGLHTTKSVVQSIFMMIALDGFFAIFFAAIDM